MASGRKRLDQASVRLEQLSALAESPCTRDKFKLKLAPPSRLVIVLVFKTSFMKSQNMDSVQSYNQVCSSPDTEAQWRLIRIFLQPNNHGNRNYSLTSRPIVKEYTNVRLSYEAPGLYTVLITYRAGNSALEIESSSV